MSEEKELEGGKSPAKKQQGNGRGAQPVQGRGRGTPRPVRKADVDIPGPGEPLEKAEPAKEKAVPKAEKPASEKPPAAKSGGAKRTAKPVQEPPQTAQEQPPAGATEEPTVRFRKGQVPVKGPKPPAKRGAVPPKRGSSQPKQGAAEAASGKAQPTGGSTPPKESAAPVTENTPPRQAARPSAESGQKSRPAPQAGGYQSRGRPVGVRGVRADTPRTAGQQPQPKGEAGNARGAQKSARPAPPPPDKPQPEEEQKAPGLIGGKRVLFGCYVALTVLSAIIVAVYIGVRLFAAPPAVKPPIVSRPPVVITTTDPDGNLVDVVEPPLSSDRKEGFYTFLLVGESQEEGGGLTDTMILVSYDVPNQKLSLMSLPRDTYVSQSGQLLNSVYTRAGGGEKGMDALRAQVSKLTGVYPDYGVSLKWEAVGELVDAIGGVWFDVPRDMKYWDPTQNLNINVSKGYQLLDGEDAMGVVRFRATYVDGDLGRIKVQQDFLKALISQCLQMDKLVNNLGEYIDIFQRNVETELTVGNLTYFALSAFSGLDMDDVTFVTLPNKSPWAGNQHLVGIPSEILKVVNEYFNPYKEDIHLSELNVVTSIPQPAATATPSPSQTPDEPEDDEPEESVRPAETKAPENNNNNNTILPPGASQSPTPTVRPSTRPAESEAPSTPAQTAEPVPEATPPAAEPPQEDDVLLPPGI